MPGAAGESEIARFVAEWLTRAGVDVETVQAAPGRPSVLGRVRGTGGGRALALYAHLDTVGVGGMDQPHVPAVRGDRLYGRGACDMNSGLAAILLAAAQLAHGARLPGDVWVMAVADEEHASLGVQAALARLSDLEARIEGCVVTEPTDMKICVAHRGFGWATITTHGRAAHTSRRAEGIDAIAHMGRVVVALENLDRQLQLRPAHPLLGHGSVVASLISGGSELFTYPAQCQIKLVRRALPGENAASVTAELQQILNALGEGEPQFSAKPALSLFRSALETQAEVPLVEALSAAAARVLGTRPALTGASYWTDAALIAEGGIPPVIYGPSGGGLHAQVEWVDLPSVRACLEVLISTAQAFCQ